MFFLQLRRNYKNIFYFREKYECEFVIKERNTITSAYQVCYRLTEENKDREINGILEALNYFNLKKGIILIFNQKDEFTIEGKNFNNTYLGMDELKKKSAQYKIERIKNINQLAVAEF